MKYFVGFENIIERLPECLKIVTDESGYSKIIFTKSFKKYEKMYRERSYFIPSKTKNYNLKIIENNNVEKDYIMNCKIHSVKVDETTLVIWGFSSFINHSCNPICYCLNINPNCDNFDFIYHDAFALKDINVGDEMTENYLFFENECDSEMDFMCECKCTNCYQNINGFNSLSQEEQTELTNTKKLIEKEIINKYPNHSYVLTS